MTTALQTAAIAFVAAKQAYDLTDAPLREFDRMLEQWKAQRGFRWAGVDLVMTDEVAGAFRGQLWANRDAALTRLEKAENALCLAAGLVLKPVELRYLLTTQPPSSRPGGEFNAVDLMALQTKIEDHMKDREKWEG